MWAQTASAAHKTKDYEHCCLADTAADMNSDLEILLNVDTAKQGRPYDHQGLKAL